MSVFFLADEKRRGLDSFCFCYFVVFSDKITQSGVGWKRRWFTLTEDRLLYFKRTSNILDNSCPGVLKGVIPITHKTEVLFLSFFLFFLFVPLISFPSFSTVARKISPGWSVFSVCQWRRVSLESF